MTDSPFSDLRGLPFYDEPISYLVLGGKPTAWEFDGWKKESMSWKTACYIHAGLSDTEIRFTGKDVLSFFESICTNSFAKFSIGAMKHAVMCTSEGLIAMHGILQRNDDMDVSFFAGGPWPLYHALQSKLDVKAEPVRTYLFQVAGPTSLTVLERATGESLDDIKFLRTRKSRIGGHDVEIGRVGMSGNLAYEVRGPLAEGSTVYDAIYRAGHDLGIQRLGWRTYLVNHVEGGFPQQNWTFQSAGLEDPGFFDFVPPFRRARNVSGSVEPANMRARYRTPFELAWSNAVKFDHDFIGRAALEREAADPKRTVATLVWNAEDVIDIHASLFQQGQEYKTLDLPTSPTWVEGVLAHADHILKDGREVGYSSGTIYSYYYRQNMSMAVIDREYAEIGTPVTIQWGDHGGRIKDVRATVERFPYLTEGRNDQVLTASITADA